MSARDRVAALLTGLAAGIAGGLLGVGGGIVMVPLLTGRFRLTQHRAHGTSLATIGAVALTALVVYAVNGGVAWTIAGVVALTSIITVRWGARLASSLSSNALRRSFAVLLVLVAARILWKPPVASAPIVTGPAMLGFGLAIGALTGLLAGLMGVGGGLIAVPAFTLVLGLSQRVAQGTSLAVILATAPFGTIENSRRGNVAWTLVPMLAIGAAVGGPASSLLAHRVPQLALTRLFAAFLVVSAVVSWVRTTKSPKPKPPQP